MLEKLRPPFKRCIEPIARALVKMGLTANMITVIGAVGTTVVGILTGITGWLFWGAVILTIFVIFDSLDGSVAKITSGGTAFGALLDSSLDRIADWGVLMGAGIYFFMRMRAWNLVHPYSTSTEIISLIGLCCTAYAMMTSFVTPYVRARAEAVGAEAKGGIATRSDRLLIILVGMALSGLFGSPLCLMICMAILAVFGTITVFQRLREARHTLENDNAK